MNTTQNELPEPDPEAEDMKRVRQALANLMEHFDTAQVFVTRHLGGDEGTVSYQRGEGNYYARAGQVKEWIVKQDYYCVHPD